MKLISGSSNQAFADKLAQHLGIEQLAVEISSFSNGEKRIRVEDSVRGENVVLVQSFSQPVDEHIIEFLLLSDALERLGARHVNAVIPWLGYSMQDKVFQPGEALSAKVVANLVSASYLKRVLLLDVHNSSIAGFFSVPTHHLSGLSLFTEYCQQQFDMSNTVVASPDFGGLKRAWKLAESLKVELVNIDKRRHPATNEIINMELHGEVRGKNVVVMDDVVISGNTVVEAAQVFKEAGATSVHFLTTHGLLVDNAVEKIADAPLDSMVITNSVAHQSLPDNFTVLDCAPLFAEHIKSWL